MFTEKRTCSFPACSSRVVLFLPKAFPVSTAGTSRVKSQLRRELRLRLRLGVVRIRGVRAPGFRRWFRGRSR